MNIFRKLFFGRDCQKTRQKDPEENSNPEQYQEQSPVAYGAPEKRIFSGHAMDIEGFYTQMSRDLVAAHGRLLRAEYLEHFPNFKILFVYEDGTVINSGVSGNQYDINSLSLGYVGEGPRCAKAFLSAAGINLSTNEIKNINPGDIITPESASEERFIRIDDRQAQHSLGKNESCISGFGTTERISGDILNQSPPALSPDGSLVSILKARGSSEATLELMSTHSDERLWRRRFSNPDCEAAFIAPDRLIVFMGISDKRSAVQILDVSSSSTVYEDTVPAMTHYGVELGWVGRKRLHSDPSSNSAARELEDDRIIQIRATSEGYQIAETAVPQICGNGPRSAPDGKCYFLSHGGLYRLTAEGYEEVYSEGRNCIIFDSKGRIYCGGGYGDMSGESYLHMIDPYTGRNRSIMLGREPIHRLHIAGDDTVISSSIVEASEFRNRHHAYVAALDVSENKSRILWDRRIEGLQWGRIPVILTVPDEDWGVLQTPDKLLLISLSGGEVLSEMGKEPSEVILGAWASTARKIYLARFPDWESQGSLSTIGVTVNS